MDLWQLHIFCKVIEQRSFSKAAQIVYLSQPTISSHIKDLEDHFGTRLVDRLSREVIPTKAGELLYGYAKRLIALSCIYGFWHYVSDLDRQQTRRYLGMYYNLQFKKLAEQVPL